MIYLDPQSFERTEPKGIVVPLAHVQLHTQRLEGRDLIEFTRHWKRLLASYFGLMIGTDSRRDGTTVLSLALDVPKALGRRAEALRTVLPSVPATPSVLDEALTKTGMAGRSNSESVFSAGDTETARLISPEDFVGQEMLAALKREYPGGAAALRDKPVEESRDMIERNASRIADALHKHGLARDGSQLSEEEINLLHSHLLQRAGLPMPYKMTPSLADAIRRAPHRMLGLLADYMNVAPEQVKAMLGARQIAPVADAGLLGKVEINRDGTAWGWAEPQAPEYLPIRKLGNVQDAVVRGALDPADVIQGRSVLRDGPVPSVGSGPAMQVEPKKITDALLEQPGARRIVQVKGFAMNAPAGVSLWISPSGDVVQVPFHSRSAHRATEGLGLNKSEYLGPEDDANQVLLNHGFIRAQANRTLLSLERTLPVTDKAVKSLEALLPAGEDRGLREVYGRIVGSNGEAVAYPRSLAELVGREPAGPSALDLARSHIKARQQAEFNATLQRHLRNAQAQQPSA